MSDRPKIPSSVETQVLTASRRRCCLCFGLQGDLAETKGQIAHLDHDPSNNDPDNLAFLCFDHHDQHDSRTSQSKGLTDREVKEHRAHLLRVLANGVPPIAPRQIAAVTPEAFRHKAQFYEEALATIESADAFGRNAVGAHHSSWYPWLSSEDQERGRQILAVVSSVISRGRVWTSEDVVRAFQALAKAIDEAVECAPSGGLQTSQRLPQPLAYMLMIAAIGKARETTVAAMRRDLGQA
jgi:hypothetical protein